jgi:hypothetical protein
MKTGDTVAREHAGESGGKCRHEGRVDTIGPFLI